MKPTASSKLLIAAHFSVYSAAKTLLQTFRYHPEALESMGVVQLGQLYRKLRREIERRNRYGLRETAHQRTAARSVRAKARAAGKGKAQGWSSDLTKGIGKRVRDEVRAKLRGEEH